MPQRRTHRSDPPSWIKPQLCKLVDKAPTGEQWVHEVKFDGYRMAARIDRGNVRLLTRTGLDWTAKYPVTAAVLAKLPVKTAYIDGELCGVRPDGVTAFELIQQASDAGAGALTYFAFDLLHLDGVDVAAMALLDRKERLATVLKDAPLGITYSEHEGGDGEAFRRAACRHGLEGIVSKRTDRRYLPGDRGVWVKSKCLNRAEFVIVGWSDPEGSRHAIGALPLGYYDADGRLLYAGRAGTGMPVETLAMLHERLKPLAIKTMPLSVPPPREQRFGGPLALSKVCIGSDLNLSPRLLTSLGLRACCGKRSSLDCEKTSRRGRCGAKHPALPTPGDEDSQTCAASQQAPAFATSKHERQARRRRRTRLLPKPWRLCRKIFANPSSDLYRQTPFCGRYAVSAPIELDRRRPTSVT